MTARVLLLRGINVGGRGKLPMAALRALLADLGARQVATYIQSGNAVFCHDSPAQALAARIEDAIESRHGFRPGALLLSAETLHAAWKDFPFPQAQAEPKTGHVWFFTPPATPDIAAMKALSAPGERFDCARARFSLYTPDGIGRSKLAAKAEQLLGVPATARNLNTVAKLATMADGLAP